MLDKVKNQPKTIQFGGHVTIDGYGGDFELLNDQKLISFVLKYKDAE